jgi:hypothetical protein
MILQRLEETMLHHCGPRLVSTQRGPFGGDDDQTSAGFECVLPFWGGMLRTGLEIDSGTMSLSPDHGSKAKCHKGTSRQLHSKSLG